METYRWHDSRPNFFKAELGTLQRGLEGSFELIEKREHKGRIIVFGKLEFDENQVENIQIDFPTKYPAAPPKVFVVQLKFDESKNIISSSSKSFDTVNQYTNNSLCLISKEDWNGSKHNIGWVLERTKSWLHSANSPEGFSADDVKEESPAPLPPLGQVLMPKDFEFPRYAETGQFQLTQFKPNYYILENNLLQNETFYFKLGQETFKWYKFNKGITFKDLFPTFNAENLLNILKENFGDAFVAGQMPNIAIYLPSDKNPWHFFKVIGNNSGQVSYRYLLSKNIDRELYHRTKDLFDDKILKNKKTTVIGLGAIGSEVCRSLANNGIGHFNLFDNDKFEIGNSVRHAADLFYVGETKVAVTKRLIVRSNPNITVNPYHIDVLDDNGLLEKSLSNSDLCIVLTAEDSVDYTVNDIYVPNFDIPFIFGRVSAGGFSGSIQVVKYRYTPCLRCLSEQGLDTLPAPEEDVNIQELPAEYGNCSSPALPGSEIDTKEIALQVSRIALQELLKGEDSTYPSSLGNQYYWHGPLGSTHKKPFEWEVKDQDRYSKCNICE